MAPTPTARTIALSLLSTGRPPEPPDFRRALEALVDDEAAWEAKVGELQTWYQGAAAALAWTAVRSWIEDESAPPFGLDGIGGDLPVPAAAIRSAMEEGLRKHISDLFAEGDQHGGTIAGIDAGFLADVASVREALTSSTLMDDNRPEERRRQRQLYVDGWPGPRRLAMGALRDVMTAAMAATVGTIYAPVVAAGEVAPDVASTEELASLCRHSEALLGRLTGLTNSTLEYVGEALAQRSRAAAPVEDGMPWGSAALRRSDDRAPHLEYALDPLDESVDTLAVAAPSPVRDFYGDEVADDAERGFLHIGCLADIPLTDHDDVPPVSAVRALYQRAIELHAAIDGWGLGAASFGEPAVGSAADAVDGASAWRVTHGADAFATAIRRHLEAKANLSRSDVRRAQLRSMCPVTGAAGRRRARRSTEGPGASPRSSGQGGASSIGRPDLPSSPGSERRDPGLPGAEGSRPGEQGRGLHGRSRSSGPGTPRRGPGRDGGGRHW